MAGPLPQKPAGEKPKRGNWLTIPFVLVASTALMAALLVLPLGYIGWTIVCGTFFFMGVAAFPYFIWGWWLGKIVESEESDSASSD